MRIQHNIAAMNSHRQLGANNGAVSKNLEKLSSGFRINRAADDAAGLAISEKMRAQIRGLETAQKNAQDGISLVQTAEGGLTEVHSMLNRMVELATQSSNGTYTDNDRLRLQDEVTQLTEEIDRISEATDFNGIKLLDGSLGSGSSSAGFSVTLTAGAANNTTGAATNAVELKISGMEAGKTLQINSTKTTGGAEGISVDKLGNITVNIKSVIDGTFTQKNMDDLIKNSGIKGLKIDMSEDIKFSSVASAVADPGTAIVAATAATDAKKATTTAGAAADGTKINVSATKAGAEYNQAVTITAGAATATGATVSANNAVALALKTTDSYTSADINKMLKGSGASYEMTFEGSLTGAQLAAATAGGAAGVFTAAGGAGVSGAGGGLNLQVGDTNDSYQKVSVSIGDMSSTALGIKTISVAKEVDAGNAIAKIKDAIGTVSATRGTLGALQNRLDHTISNIGVTAENMTAAESRIRDVDMAKEMMDFTKNNILTQAAQAMLAQANQVPQGVLQLLR